MMRQELSTILFCQTLNHFKHMRHRVRDGSRSFDHRIELVECVEHEAADVWVTSDCFGYSTLSELHSQSIRIRIRMRYTSIRIHPPRTHTQCLDPLGSKLNTQFRHDHIHSRFRDRIAD